MFSALTYNLFFLPFLLLQKFTFNITCKQPLFNPPPLTRHSLFRNRVSKPYEINKSHVNKLKTTNNFASLKCIRRELPCFHLTQRYPLIPFNFYLKSQKREKKIIFSSIEHVLKFPFLSHNFFNLRSLKILLSLHGSFHFLNHSLKPTVTEIIVHHYVPVMSNRLAARFLYLGENYVYVCIAKTNLINLFPFKRYAEAVYVDNSAEMGELIFVHFNCCRFETALTFRSGKEVFSREKDCAQIK